MKDYTGFTPASTADAVVGKTAGIWLRSRQWHEERNNRLQEWENEGGHLKVPETNGDTVPPRSEPA